MSILPRNLSRSVSVPVATLTTPPTATVVRARFFVHFEVLRDFQINQFLHLVPAEVADKASSVLQSWPQVGIFTHKKCRDFLTFGIFMLNLWQKNHEKTYLSAVLIFKLLK